jgi:alkylation response protein AidB-like acyl-CoA dehydrogenase
MNPLFDGLERALADHCTPEVVRGIEAGGSAQALWDTVESLGYADAFVAAEHDGIGLPWCEAFALGHALGRAGYPLPLLETAIARALLTAAGNRPPAGPIVLADAGMDSIGRVSLPPTPGLRCASHVLVRHDGRWHLLALEAGTAIPGDWRPQLSGAVITLDLAEATQLFDAPHSAAVLCAAPQAAEMAGSMAALLDMTLAYANDRRQFGRAIGQFQALQQDIAAMAEQVTLATLAARLGFAGSIAAPDALRALNAKLGACDAAERVVAIAHAVHGAIGMTEEYPLGLHARRLHEWRHAGATAGACARRIGTALLQRQGRLLDFVREALPAH